MTILDLPRRPAVSFRLKPGSGRLLAGGTLVLAALACAVAAPLIAPNDPQHQDLLTILAPPAWAEGGDAQYPLGTDSLGRCIATQLIFGARVAMIVGFSAATGAMLLGTLLALLAGYFGGWVDRTITYLVDLWMSVPPVVLSLTLMVGLGTGIGNVVLSIMLVDWTRFCRVLRSEVMLVRRRDYVSAARLLGFGHARVIVRDVLPAVAPLIVTLFTLEVGIAVVVEAILSFVGLSVPANVPAWGVMIADARGYMHQSFTGLLAPVLAMLATVMGFNLVGDGIRLRFDPHLRANRS